MSRYLLDFIQVFIITLIPLLLAGLLWLAVRQLRIRRGASLPPLRTGQILLNFALAGDVLMTVFLTLLMRTTSTVTLTQFHLFASWREAWNAWSPHLFEQLFLNIGVFVPFGALLAMRFPKLRQAWAVGSVSFGFSLCIETMQLIFRRGVFDADDLFCNTAGGILGGALVCMILHTAHRRPGRAILAALPLLAGGLACVAFFGSYAVQPYGNLSIAPNYRYPMRDVAFSVEFTLDSEPSNAPVYVLRSFTETEAEAAAEAILAGVELTPAEVDIAHYAGGSDFSLPDNGIFLTFTRDGGSWYLSHEKGGAHHAPAIGTAEQLCQWLSGFGLDLTGAEVTYAGNQLWYVVPAAADRATAGKIVCHFFDDGRWTVSADTPVLCEVACAPILTPAEAADAIRQGRFRWFYDQIDTFSSLSLNDLSLVWRTDTKGYQVPVWKATVTADGKNAVILIPALR